MSRTDRVGEAVRDGADRWRARRTAERDGPSPSDDRQEEQHPFYVADPPAPDVLAGEQVLVSLPRRTPYAAAATVGLTPPTLPLAAPFRAGLWLTVRRAMVWLRGIATFTAGLAVDRMRGTASSRSAAVRLRTTLASLGGTFIKLGQQASVRADLLPPAYCEELSSLLDRVDPFPVDQAVAAVERVIGAPLAEVFAAFDPEPIGSASVACVYQAVLLDGTKVAVKVRRPGIGPQMAADLRVIGWIFGLTERLTLVRPGFTDNVLEELRSSLLEELDFHKEARFQEIFGRRAAEAERHWFGAPKVFGALSGADVITEEFVSGVWLTELLAVVESDDTEALARLASLGIDPKEVARRLVWVSHWGLWDSVLFHGDPHPANIVVQADNRLIFVDFGAMGTLPASRRAGMREIYNLMEAEDLEGMARLSLTLLEPLPPIDTDKVIKAVQEVFWEALLGARSEQSEWFERTTAQLWLGFFKVTSRFRIPMSYDTLRLIRATLLYDTLAARLDHDIDLPAQYRTYRRDAGRVSRRRVAEAAERRFEQGLDGEDYLRLEQLGSVLQKAAVQAERLMTLQRFNFGAYVSKLVSAVVMVIVLGFQLVAVTAAIVLLVTLFGPEGTGSMGGVFDEVVQSRWYQAVIGVLVLLSIRRILFRLKDREL